MSNVITQKDLKDACNELHDLAEKTQLAKDLVAGSIDLHLYKLYCYQLYLIVDAIENKVNVGEKIKRKESLLQDVGSSIDGELAIMPATKAYVVYLKNLDVSKLKGHIYAHYLAWLYGGQFISKKLSLPKQHLIFDNVKECIDYIRSSILVDLTTDDAEEAKIAFTFTILMYNELYELY